MRHSAERRSFEAVLAQNAAAREAVRILGPVDQSIMLALYRCASALLFPSLIEGFGLAVLEVMASGTPVITSRRPPFTEYLTDDNAILVDPTNVSDISRGICLAFDPADRQSRIQHGMNIAASHSWQAVVGRCATVYSELLAAQGEIDAGNAFHRSLA